MINLTLCTMPRRPDAPPLGTQREPARNRQRAVDRHVPPVTPFPLREAPAGRASPPSGPAGDVPAQLMRYISAELVAA